jgi:phospholipid transport system substrate-binding protein
MKHVSARTIGLVAACACLALLGASGARSQTRTQTPSPEQVVASLHEALIAVAADQSLSREERFARLAPVVDATHDLAYIAELSIRREWRDLSPEQRDAFVSAFRRLSIMTYVTRFANVGRGAFKIIATEPEKSGRVRVRAEIERESAEPVALDYLLHESGGVWRIANILADGVSDLALKRAEYQRLLTDGTIEDLIAELDRQTENLG